jgi:hypothetical protein
LVCANVFGLELESLAPGHDGYPLALVLIKWTASNRHIIKGRPFEVGFECSLISYRKGTPS